MRSGLRGSKFADEKPDAEDERVDEPEHSAHGDICSEHAEEQG